MAKIVHSEAAPSEAVHYSFAGVEFDLGGKSQAFETTDPVVLSNAEAHPWLAVERDEADLVRGEYRDTLDPKDDVLSAVNSVANDPEAARAASAPVVEVIAPLAVDAGKDQDKPVKTGRVAETLAADNSDKKDKN